MIDQLFAEAAARGLQLGHLRQYSYVINGKTKTDHWEAAFHDSKGHWCSGAGRSALLALQAALHGDKIDDLAMLD